MLNWGDSATGTLDAGRRKSSSQGKEGRWHTGIIGYNMGDIRLWVLGLGILWLRRDGSWWGTKGRISDSKLS